MLISKGLSLLAPLIVNRVRWVIVYSSVHIYLVRGRLPMFLCPQLQQNCGILRPFIAIDNSCRVTDMVQSHWSCVFTKAVLLKVGD